MFRHPFRSFFRIAGLALALTVSGVTALPASANPIQYSNRATWQAASNSLTTITFAGLGGSPDAFYGFAGLTVSGVTFAGTSSYLYVRTFSPTNFLYGPSFAPGDHITVTLPSGVTSLGWDFGNFYPPGGVTVQFSTGQTFTASGFSGFIGFTSSSPITSFQISSPGFPTVSNFSFGTSNQVVPEPSSMLLLVTGIFGVAAQLRRK